MAALPLCDSEDRKNHSFLKDSRQNSRRLHLFVDCSQLDFAQAAKQRFYVMLARLLIRHFLRLTDLLLLCVTSN